MDLFSPHERRLFWGLVVIMVFVAFAEVLGISLFLVLLRVLSDPQKILENEYLNWGYETFGFTTQFSFQVAMSVGVLLAMALSLVIKAAGAYTIIRFATMRGYAISSRLLEAYLHQPYAWFLEKNSADVAKSVLNEVHMVVNGIIGSGAKMVANIILAVMVIAFLVFVDVLVAILAATLLGGAYIGIYLWLRKKMLRVGEAQLAANQGRFRLTNEATGGFKEVKLMSLEAPYVDRFRAPARSFARATAMNQIMNQTPRFALEALTYAVLFGAILILLVRNSGDLAAAVPVLGVFGISAMRLLPALQQVYGAFANIRATRPILDHIHKEYTEAVVNVADRSTSAPHETDLPLTRSLELDNITFHYSSGDRPAIEDLSLEIPALSTIGIVGGTGAGKTTVVDIILGLLTPDSGRIMVDGQVLTAENLHLWRRTIGYVPQTIYLTDSTIAQNIAFGIPPDRIDMEAVERAARIAALHDFVMSDLPRKYETVVGERGVRLSGGQRQRIGIARALYHDPSLLILDEATSALDNLTERAVMEAVQRVRNTKTVIMIAHRLSTIRNCDRIFLMERGRVQAVGTYDDLVDRNETFRKMAAG